MKKPLSFFCLFIFFNCCPFLAAQDQPASNAAGAQAGSQKILVQSGSWTEDLHRAFMAVKLAEALQKEGAQVTLLLNLESARAANTDVPNDVVWGGGEPFSYYYKAFVEAGGEVLVCPHCAKACGLTQENLREGARIGSVGDLAQAILDADKILDY